MLARFLLVFSLCLSVLSPALAPGQEPDLRLKLERAYAQWRTAVEARDAKAWASAITMHRQVITRNTVVSQGLAFPKTVFETMMAPADTRNLRLLEAQGVGDTAHLLYFGQVNMGGAPEQIPHNLLMLKFFRQNGVWKFDSNKLIHLAGQPELRSKLLRNEPTDFLDLPEFTPPGTPPATPAISPIPDYITGCTVQAVGYETEIKVNGYEHFATDGVLKFFILGGLRNGGNQVTISATPMEVPKDVTRSLEIGFFTKPKSAGEQGKRVFHYELANHEGKSVKTSTWTVTMPSAQEMSVRDTGKK
ncbi:MAG: hypothetical protein V4662_13240 [Verrucomicrobiota bacterium]